MFIYKHLSKIVFLTTYILITSKVSPTNISICLYKTYSSKKICENYESFDQLKEKTSNETYKFFEATGNNLTTLDANFLTDIANVEEIWLINNDIKEIKPGAFKNLSDVALVISDNKIQNISNGVFTNLTGITSLNLRNNLIESIEQNAFTNMTRLKEINLSNNFVKIWMSDWFVGTQLIHIDFSNNLIENLPENAFEFARNYSQIVHKINLKSNKLIMLNSFSGLSKVNNLYLSNNSIETIAENVFEKSEITYVDLSKNNIKCLPENMGNILKKDQCTKLFFNPWNCTCFDALVKFNVENKLCVYTNFHGFCS